MWTLHNGLTSQHKIVIYAHNLKLYKITLSWEEGRLTHFLHICDMEMLLHGEQPVAGKLLGKWDCPCGGTVHSKMESHTFKLHLVCEAVLQRLPPPHTPWNTFTHASPRERSRSQIAALRSALIGGKIRWLWVRLVKKHWPQWIWNMIHTSSQSLEMSTGLQNTNLELPSGLLLFDLCYNSLVSTFSKMFYRVNYYSYITIYTVYSIYIKTIKFKSVNFLGRKHCCKN